MPAKLRVNQPDDFIQFERTEIEQGIHQRFEKQVLQRPDKIALEWQSGSYTYAELNRRANVLAHFFIRGLPMGLERIGILLPNNSETIVSMLGCMKAGKAYVPLDVNFPPERLAQMTSDCQPQAILCDSANCQLAMKIAPMNCRVINLQEADFSEGIDNPNLKTDPMDLAYILYTSGTTGRPKGIAFVHRNLLHTKMCLTNELFYSPSDRVTWLHSPSFGSSIVDIYCALLNGGTMLPWDSKRQGFTGMAAWLKEKKATTFHWIPSALRQFSRTIPEGTIFDSVRISVMAGEPLTRREVDLHRKFFSPRSHLVNQVGTGESYNYYLYRMAHDTPLEGSNVPGGHPVSPERELLILDDQRKPLPRGQIGEIGIRSNYMSIGYWRDEALTRQKFVNVDGDPTPVYLTGDLGQLDQDGCLTHLGRKDFQIKVRGIRIEPADIEHVLNSAPCVKEAAVWIAKNNQGEDQLVAYVVNAPGKFDESMVIAHLSAKLPDYMVPRRLVILESLPMLPTGKVNRRALPNPFVDEGPSGNDANPSCHQVGRMERLASLYREVLGLPNVDVRKSFGDLGGDSLGAAVLAARIHSDFGVEIPFMRISGRNTLTDVADALGMISGKLVTGLSARHSFVNLEEIRALADQLSSSTDTSVVDYSSPKDLIIIGAGQFGREAYTWARQIIAGGYPMRIKGFLDTRKHVLDGMGYAPGIIADVESYEIKPNDVFVGAIGDPKEKLKYYGPIIRKGGRFINLIHPSAVIGHNVKLGAGIIIGPFCSITCDAQIGNHVSLGSHSNVAHDCSISNWCQISSHCGVNGLAKLGSGVFMGSHSCLIPSISAGAWAFIGAGSICISDVSPGDRVFGNPAKSIF